MSCFSVSPYLSLIIILVQVYLYFSCLKIIFQSSAGCFGCFLAKSNLDFLFFRVISGFHLEMNPHSSSVLDLVRCCQVVFHKQGQSLQASTLVVFCGFSGLLVMLSFPVHSTWPLLKLLFSLNIFW